jgi:hypothetical protein
MGHASLLGEWLLSGKLWPLGILRLASCLNQAAKKLSIKPFFHELPRVTNATPPLGSASESVAESTTRTSAGPESEQPFLLAW